MNETPRLDDFRENIKYSRWDGTQRLDALEAEELLSAMSDELLSGGDLEDAMARLSRWGIPGRMEGMKDLLERLRSAEAPNEQMRQAMERLAQDRLAQLDALPEDFGRAVRALKYYEFV